MDVNRMARIANFEGDRNGGEKSVRDVHRDVEHKAVNAGRRSLSEIENTPVCIGYAAARVAPTVAGDEDIEFHRNARRRESRYRI